MNVESIIGVAKPSSPEEVAARRAEARERRIAAARTSARPSGEAVAAQAGRTGNGGPPTLDPAAEVRALGELLYGERFTTELARDVGEDPRTVRFWLAGQRAVPPRAMAWIRAAARRRAAALVAIVGAEAA